MAKYLVCGKYIGEGVQGLLSEGGSGRRSEIHELVGSLGGRVESVYYAFGDYDIYGIFDMPDNNSMAAFSLRASASGMLSVTCIPLMQPEDIDEAAKKQVGTALRVSTGCPERSKRVLLFPCPDHRFRRPA